MVKVTLECPYSIFKMVVDSSSNKEVAQQLLEGTFEWPEFIKKIKNDKGDSVRFKEFNPLEYQSSQVSYESPVYRWFKTENPSKGDEYKWSKQDDFQYLSKVGKETEVKSVSLDVWMEWQNNYMLEMLIKQPVTVVSAEANGTDESI